MLKINEIKKYILRHRTGGFDKKILLITEHFWIKIPYFNMEHLCQRNLKNWIHCTMCGVCMKRFETIVLGSQKESGREWIVSACLADFLF